MNALPPMPVLDEFTADVTQQVMSDRGTLPPEVYRLRWLRALIALAGVMEWVNDKQGCPIGARNRRAVWPLKEALERELGEWSPYRAAEIYLDEQGRVEHRRAELDDANALSRRGKKMIASERVDKVKRICELVDQLPGMRSAETVEKVNRGARLGSPPLGYFTALV